LAQDVKSKRFWGYKLWLGGTLISNLLQLVTPVSLVHNLISAKNMVPTMEETRGRFKVRQ